MRRASNPGLRTAVLCAGAMSAACATSVSLAGDIIWLTADGAAEQISAAVNYGATFRREMADEDRVVALELVSPSGTIDLRQPLTPQQHLGKPVLESKRFAPPADSVLAVTYDSGFWIRSATNKSLINTSKLLLPDGTAPHWTVKYGKLLLGPGAFRRELHTRMELVALEDPFSLRAGDKLPVKVVLNGAPLPGIAIAYGDGLQPIPDEQLPRVKTGHEGIAEIPFARSGPYLLVTEYETAALQPQLASYDHIYASLTFDTSR